MLFYMGYMIHIIDELISHAELAEHILSTGCAVLWSPEWLKVLTGSHVKTWLGTSTFLLKMSL